MCLLQAKRFQVAGVDPCSPAGRWNREQQASVSVIVPRRVAVAIEHHKTIGYRNPRTSRTHLPVRQNGYHVAKSHPKSVRAPRFCVAREPRGTRCFCCGTCGTRCFGRPSVCVASVEGTSSLKSTAGQVTVKCAKSWWTPGPFADFSDQIEGQRTCDAQWDRKRFTTTVTLVTLATLVTLVTLTIRILNLIDLRSTLRSSYSSYHSYLTNPADFQIFHFWVQRLMRQMKIRMHWARRLSTQWNRPPPRCPPSSQCSRNQPSSWKVLSIYGLGVPRLPVPQWANVATIYTLYIQRAGALLSGTECRKMLRVNRPHSIVLFVFLLCILIWCVCLAEYPGINFIIWSRKAAPTSQHSKCCATSSNAAPDPADEPGSKSASQSTSKSNPFSSHNGLCLRC